MAKKPPKTAGETPPAKATKKKKPGNAAKFPRHSVEKALRIPGFILDQNAGKPCSDSQAATYAGLGTPIGAFAVEIGSAVKYGFLERPEKKRIAITALARKAIRPQHAEDRIDALREAILILQR